MKKMLPVLLLYLAILVTACTSTETPAVTVTQTSKPDATSVPTQSPLDTAQPGSGTISGKLTYPSLTIPALRVVAFRVDNGTHYFVDTKPGQITFKLNNLPPGTYHIIAYSLSSPNIAGGYTHAVLCGLKMGCTDQSLVDVVVAAQQSIMDVNPGDWYTPEGAFPPMPTP